MPLELITPPAVEPVSLDEVKAHLKVDGTDDDALIGALITAARAQAEWHTHRAFVTQDWIYWRDELPDHGVVKIPLAPLQSLSSITLYPRDGTTQVLDAASYQVDAVGAPPRIALAPSLIAATDLRIVNGFAAAFTAGYGDTADDVPEAMRRALLQMVGHLYEHRGDDSEPAPQSALALLAPYRMLNL